MICRVFLIFLANLDLLTFDINEQLLVLIFILFFEEFE